MIKKLTVEKLRLLADAGGVREVRIVGQGAGFVLIVATRDTAAFEAAGLTVINPWTVQPRRI